MSLIIPATINGSTRRMALYEMSTRSHPYFHDLISFGPVKLAGKNRTGGFVKPQHGNAEITAEVFGSSVPPADITLPAYLMTDAGDVLIAEATGQLSSIKAASAMYKLRGDEYDDTVSSGSTASLTTYFGTACTTLGLTLDSSLATDYDLSWPLSNERPLIDILDEIAEYTSHGFTIGDGTLKLIDTAQSNGTITLDSRFDFFDTDVNYEAPKFYSIFKGGDYSVSGSYSQGDPYTQSILYHSTQSYIEAQLTRKKALLDKWWITFSMPIGTNSISYGQKVTFTDYSKFIPLRVEMWAREFQYTLNTGTEKLTIAGEGTVAAA